MLGILVNSIFEPNTCAIGTCKVVVTGAVCICGLPINLFLVGNFSKTNVSYYTLP